MTDSTVIPEPQAEFSDEDFQTATSRVHAARERLLQTDAARAAHDALVTTIGERVARRRASLAQLRKALGLTQAQMADSLGIDQAEVSKMERRLNHKLATLERFIQATGGTLRVSAVYGDVEVHLDLGDLLALETGNEAAPPATPGGTAKRPAKAAPVVGGAKKTAATAAAARRRAVTKETTVLRSTRMAGASSKATASRSTRSSEAAESPRKRTASQPVKSNATAKTANSGATTRKAPTRNHKTSRRGEGG